jgi:hypothetical protein
VLYPDVECLLVGKDLEYSIHKIVFFLELCKSLHIKRSLLFQIKDLLVWGDNDVHKKHALLVLRTIVALEKHARKQGWRGAGMNLKNTGGLGINSLGREFSTHSTSKGEFTKRSNRDSLYIPGPSDSALLDEALEYSLDRNSSLGSDTQKDDVDLKREQERHEQLVDQRNSRLGNPPSFGKRSSSFKGMEKHVRNESKDSIDFSNIEEAKLNRPSTPEPRSNRPSSLESRSNPTPEMRAIRQPALEKEELRPAIPEKVTNGYQSPVESSIDRNTVDQYLEIYKSPTNVYPTPLDQSPELVYSFDRSSRQSNSTLGDFDFEKEANKRWQNEAKELEESLKKLEIELVEFDKLDSFHLEPPSDFQLQNEIQDSDGSEVEFSRESINRNTARISKTLSVDSRRPSLTPEADQARILADAINQRIESRSKTIDNFIEEEVI